MPAFYVYILRCSDNSYYTGHTDDIEKRLTEHYRGLIKCYTRTRRPLQLIFMQEFSSRYEALSAEQKIKGWRRQKKEALMAYDWSLLVQLSSRNKK